MGNAGPSVVVWKAWLIPANVPFALGAALDELTTPSHSIYSLSYAQHPSTLLRSKGNTRDLDLVMEGPNYAVSSSSLDSFAAAPCTLDFATLSFTSPFHQCQRLYTPRHVPPGCFHFAIAIFQSLPKARVACFPASQIVFFRMAQGRVRAGSCIHSSHAASSH